MKHAPFAVARERGADAVRIVILDSMLPTQIAERPEDLQGIEVVWAGTDRDALVREVPHLVPHVVVCSLALLGEDPTEFLRSIEDLPSVELVVVLHDFARRTVRDGLIGERRRVVQAPVSVARLRSTMMGVLVRHMLSGSSSSMPPRRPDSGVSAHVRGRRFSPAQLARLMEISTAVDCECPNHLSQLVSALGSFETYSAQCENKNDRDAAIHSMLHRETARARDIMEQALAKLIEHEGIKL